MRRQVLLLSLLLHAVGVGGALLHRTKDSPRKELPEALQVSLMGLDIPTKIPAPTIPPAPAVQPTPPNKPPVAPPPQTKPAAATAVASPVVADNPVMVAPPPADQLLSQVTSQTSASVPAPAARPAVDSSTVAAAPASASNVPVRQSVSIDAAYAASNPQPPYPPIAKRLGEQGTVVLRVLVAADGTARDVQVKKSSGSPTLDRSAETTIKQWRFIPAKIDGKPVDEWYETRWTFKLEG